MRIKKNDMDLKKLIFGVVCNPTIRSAVFFVASASITAQIFSSLSIYYFPDMGPKCKRILNLRVERKSTESENAHSPTLGKWKWKYFTNGNIFWSEYMLSEYELFHCSCTNIYIILVGVIAASLKVRTRRKF